MSEIEFVDGLRVFAPGEGAPDYIIANLAIEREELAAWLRTHPEKVRIDIKRSKTGKLYAAVNNWKPKSADAGNQQAPESGANAPMSAPRNAAQPEFTHRVHSACDDIPF